MVELKDVMEQQNPIPGGWICPTCRNHKGGLNCEKNVFICWVGANMTGCRYYEKERRKAHDN